MATGWTPLVLSPATRPAYDSSPAPRSEHKLDPSTSGKAPSRMETVLLDKSLNRTALATDTKTASRAHEAPTNAKPSSPKTRPRSNSHPNLTTLTSEPPKQTPFDKALPAHVPESYLKDTHVGNRYTIYTLVPLVQWKLMDVVHSILENAESEDWWSTIVLAPTWDFSSGWGRSLRDIYDYHTSLLETVRSNPHNLQPKIFLVTVHQDWETNGILIVNLDCKPDAPGTIGMMRVAHGIAGSCLVCLENNPYAWKELKTSEECARFSNPIRGYTGSKYEKLSEEWFDSANEEVVVSANSHEKTAKGKTHK